MAEIISLGAGIAAFIQIAGSIASVCKSYIETVQDCPKDLRLIYIESSSIKLLFESLQFLNEDDSDDSKASQILFQPDGPILGCGRAMTELSSLLPPITTTPFANRAKRQKLSLNLVSLAWPLKVSRARRLLDEIMQHKSTITLGLTGDLCRDIKGVKTDIRKMNQSLTDSDIRTVSKWLEQINPSSNHNAARSLYEDGTASWVLRSEEWMKWITLQSRAVWLYGIPGAGKTIMMSYLIEEVERKCNNSRNKNDVCLYYYCYHGHNHDATFSFLRWLLSQLLRKTGIIPLTARKLFTEGKEPNLTQLLDLMVDMTDYFDTIFVMVDALDESHDRQNILNLLQSIVVDDRLKHVQLFMSSRDYIEIRRTALTFATPLSLSNPLVESDIKRYVAAKIAANTTFNRWPQTLRLEVEGRLSTGAKGMFRWAVCQLDILRRLNRIDKIRSALQSLPETLDETYERIFSSIHPEERNLVRHAIRWICFHSSIWWWESLGPSTLLDLYPLSTGEDHSEANYLFTVESLKESCGCLITFTRVSHRKMEIPVLAHYTVREFLESDRLSGNALHFSLDPRDDYCDLINAVMTTSLKAKPEDSIQTISSSLSKGSRIYCLTSSFNLIQSHPEVRINPKLVFRFLNPVAPHFSGFLDTRRLQCRDEDWVEISVCRGSDVTLLLWKWAWDAFNGPSIAGTFILLMLLRRHDLAQLCLLEYGPKTILEAEFSIASEKYPIWYSDKHPLKECAVWFTGTVVEYFAAYALLDSLANAAVYFDFCYKHGIGHIDFSKTLPYHATAHRSVCKCGKEDGGNGHCTMKELLAQGADPNTRNFELSPLQICCFTRDLRGIQALLDAGANPNYIGQKGVLKWDSKFLLHKFAPLRGRSPLRILRTKSDFDQRFNYAIEALLLLHGAKDFDSSGDEDDSRKEENHKEE